LLSDANFGTQRAACKVIDQNKVLIIFALNAAASLFGAPSFIAAVADRTTGRPN
jgi:hypothetical protein